jgi:hypothetical protein
LLEEIKNRQKFTRREWTQKTIDALLGAMELIDKNDREQITYQDWRRWQEQLARKLGWSQTETFAP